MIDFKFRYEDIFKNMMISFAGSPFFPIKADFWLGANNKERNADYMYSFRYSDKDEIDLNEVASQSLFTYEEDGKIIWEKFDPLGCFKILNLSFRAKD